MRCQFRWLTATAAVALCSCGDESATQLATSGLSAGDRDIAAALYAGAPRTPSGFVADPAPPSFAQVTTYHIKSSQLAAPFATQHEVCSDDWSEALAWSEEVAAQESPYLDLVETGATPLYFEFGRVPRGDPTRYVRMRVLRCEYLDRSGVDLAFDDGFAGVLNRRPLDAAVLRDSSEYLWLFTLYNNSGNAVVASEGRGPGLTHAVTIASLERGSGCDRVVLRDWTHAAAEQTGVLMLAVTSVREFRVRESAGAIESCHPFDLATVVTSAPAGLFSMRSV